MLKSEKYEKWVYLHTIGEKWRGNIYSVFSYNQLYLWHKKVPIFNALLAKTWILGLQGCIICSIIPSGMEAREVSSEHVENMEMSSCSPT